MRRTLTGKSTGRTTNQIFEEWVQFLLKIQLGRKNNALVTLYFFGKFAELPEIFYEFLVYLKKKLLRKKASTESRKIAEHYLNILSPLAERFGIFEEKNVLDTLCFQSIDPKGYTQIEDLFFTYKKQSEKTITRVLQQLKNLMKEQGYACDIKGRFKNEYSVYKKLQKKRSKSALALHDIFAFRIVLLNNSTEECFEVLNMLHDKFSPVASRFKDYITIPKINGYQSIHTCLNHVLPNLDLPIEVQIRTKIMDDFAEKGVASHWLYSRDKRTNMLTETEQKLVQHFSALSHQNEAGHVYCLSRTGDIFALPIGSTILDFAYAIHTDVGNKAVSAVVNMDQKPLKYAIQDGDQIEILKAKKKQVSKEWVHYAHNSSTRKKIHENT